MLEGRVHKKVLVVRGREPDDFADLAALDHLPGQFCRRRAHVVETDHRHDIFLARGLGHLGGDSRARCEWLFAQHMLASSQGSEGHFPVQMRWRDNRHHVHPRIVDEFAPVARRAVIAEARGVRRSSRRRRCSDDLANCTVSSSNTVETSDSAMEYALPM